MSYVAVHCLSIGIILNIHRAEYVLHILNFKGRKGYDVNCETNSGNMLLL